MITDKQQAIWEYVCEYRGRDPNGRSPSYEEIADHLGWKSVRSVHYHVDGLIDAGMLEKDETKKRILQPTGKTPDELEERHED
ncbi:MAG: LexA family protein [Bradymonadaceae bacterium]